MNLFFRLFWLLISARSRNRIELLDDCVLKMRVWPSDLDVNRHLTNARYLSMMDLGRIELMVQTGVFKKVLKRGWLPVVANANLQFKHQINPFQLFHLTTRIIGWDEKWIFLEQRFETDKGVAAVGIIKSLFRGKNGNIPTEKLLALANYQGEKIDLPPELNFMMTKNNFTINHNAIANKADKIKEHI